MTLTPYPEYKPSGVDWLGDIPSHWEVYPHRNLFEEVIERGYPDEEMLSVTISQGVIRQAQLLANSSKKDSSNVDKSNYKLVSEGDIAYNKMRAWQGAIGASAYRGIISPAYIIVRLREEQHNIWYFHYLFRTPLFTTEAERWSYGITSDQWSLRYGEFKQIYSPLPPPDEQAAIVRFLDAAETRIRRYIRAKQKLIKLLNEQKQAIIQQAVTRGLNPDVPMKDSGVEWLGEIPAHWEVRRIATFSPKITNGWVGPTRDILTDSGTPYIQSLHIKDGEVRFNKPYYVSEDWLTKHEKARLMQGDVVVVQTGDIGQVACISEEFNGAGCHALIIISTQRDVVIGEYLSFFLRSKYGYNILKSIQTGALHPHLNVTFVREIQVTIPLVNEQVQIIGYLGKELQHIHRAIEMSKNQIEQIQEYRTRLIADIVTGKVDARGLAFEMPEAFDDDDLLDVDADDGLLEDDELEEMVDGED
jgi:type I restriction enzyme, S subunit